MADRTTQVVVEVLGSGLGKLRVTQLAVEVLVALGTAISPECDPIWVGDPQGLAANVTAFDPSTFDPSSFEE